MTRRRPTLSAAPLLAACVESTPPPHIEAPLTPEMYQEADKYIARCKANGSDPTHCHVDWSGLSITLSNRRPDLESDSLVILNNVPFNFDTGERL